MRKTDSRIRSRPSGPCLELELRLEDGRPWRLRLSPGMERFIGFYPKVEGLDSGAPLLAFRLVGAD